MINLGPASGKSLARENYTIFSAVTLAYTGFSASFPFLVVFLNQVKGVPLSQVGIVYLASGMIGLAGQWIGGRLTDRLGTKTMTIVGLAGSVAMYSLITVFVLKDLPVLLYIISYPVLSLFNNLSQLALSSHISDRDRAHMASGMSLLYVGVNLGFTIGPVTGGVLVAYYGYWSIFAFGAITTILASVVALSGIKTNPKYALRIASTNGGIRADARLEKGLISFFTLILISWFVIGYQAIPLSIFESQFLSLSSIEIGIVLTTNGLLITLLQVPVSRWMGVERRMRLAPIALGSFIMAAGFFEIAYSSDIFLLELGIVLTTLGEIMVAVPTQVVATLFSREYNRGKYQGYYFSFSRTGLAFSSYVGPLVFSVFISTAYVGWVLIAAVSAAAGLGYYLLSPTIEREYTKTGTATGNETGKI